MELDRRDFLRSTAAMSLTLAVEPAWAQAAKAEVLWLGQAATKITTLTGKVIVIDPFLVNNPKTPPDYKNLDKLGKVDVILVTHGHGDHTGDVKDLAARTSASVSSVVSCAVTARSTTSSTAPRHCASAGATSAGRSTAIAVSIGFTPMRAKFAA